MKKYFLIITLIIFMFACKKNAYKQTDHIMVENKALVKFGLFSLSTAPPTLTIFNNGTKISPALSLFSSSTLNSYGYPGGGFNIGGSTNADYAALDPGSNKLEFYTMIPNLNTIITKFYETTIAVESDKRYTLYLSDSVTKSVLAPDDVSFNIDSGYAKVRFVNLIPNSTGLDMYKNDSLIVSNIGYQRYSDFLIIPASLVDSFAIRSTGTPKDYAKNATAYYRLATNTNKRIFSIVAKGYLGITASPRNPSVSVILNK